MRDLACVFTEQEGPVRICGEVRGRGHVRCELPLDHDNLPRAHYGRGRDGRWIGWPAERLAERVRRRQDRVEATLSPPRSDGLSDPEWVTA